MGAIATHQLKQVGDLFASNGWFVCYLTYQLVTWKTWRLDSWMSEESSYFMKLRDILEALGVTYKKRSYPSTHATTIQSSLVTTMPDAKGGGVQGYPKSDMYEDDDGTVGHEFSELNVDANGKLCLKRKILGLVKLRPYETNQHRQ